MKKLLIIFLPLLMSMAPENGSFYFSKEGVTVDEFMAFIRGEWKIMQNLLKTLADPNDHDHYQVEFDGYAQFKSRSSKNACLELIETLFERWPLRWQAKRNDTHIVTELEKPIEDFKQLFLLDQKPLSQSFVIKTYDFMLDSIENSLEEREAKIALIEKVLRDLRTSQKEEIFSLLDTPLATQVFERAQVLKNSLNQY